MKNSLVRHLKKGGKRCYYKKQLAFSITCQIIYKTRIEKECQSSALN